MPERPPGVPEGFGPTAKDIRAGEPRWRQFATFQQWIDKAPMWVSAGDALFDSRGRRCLSGHDMMAAADAGAFPVTVARVSDA